MNETRRCGFVAVLGAPNAGKSTLINRLVGSKVSIVSPKVQTTRRRILGVAMEGAAQIVLIDTPGIFAPKRRLERAMVAAAWQGAQDADLILLIVDSNRGFDPDTRDILAKLKSGERRAILVLNKVDLVEKTKLLKLADNFHREGIFDEIFMVSASGGDGVEDLKKRLAAKVPEGPWHFPEDELTDLAERDFAAEVTREKLFEALRQELPYAIHVETDQWTERKDGSVRIEQSVYVMRDGQKAIVLGKGGHQLKEVGAAARLDLEAALERRVHLFLHVKVRENWAEDRGKYRDMGLDFDS